VGNYLIKPGYCLHLPHGRFAHPGEEVELSGKLEEKILEEQGWKVTLVVKPAKEPKQPEPKEPGDKEISGPPRDRAVKGAVTR